MGPGIGPFGPMAIGPFGPPTCPPGPDMGKCEEWALIVVMLPPTGPLGPPDMVPGMEHIGPDIVHMGPPGTFIGPHGPLIDIVDIGTLAPHIELGVLQLGNIGEPALSSEPPGLLNLGRKSRLGGPRGPPPIELF